MHLPIDDMSSEHFSKLLELFTEAMNNKRMPRELGTPEDIQAGLQLLILIKRRNSVIMEALHQSGALTEKETSDRLSPYEKSIQTIVRHDMIEKITNPEKKKHNWMNNKFLTFLSSVLPDGDFATAKTAKGLYDKHKNVYANRLARMRRSPKVAVLSEKYPDIDVQKALSLGILSDKLDTTVDDLNFLDKLIGVLCRR